KQHSGFPIRQLLRTAACLLDRDCSCACRFSIGTQDCHGGTRRLHGNYLELLWITKSTGAGYMAMSVPPKWVDVDGIRTRYFEAGNGEPMLLITGGNFGSADSVSIVESLDRNFDGLSRRCR